VPTRAIASSGSVNSSSKSGRLRFLTDVTSHPLEVKNFGLSSQINQAGRPIQDHIGVKLRLVYLTGLGAGDSDTDRDIVFNQIGQIVVGTVPRFRLNLKIPLGVRPQHSTVNKEKGRFVPFGMGDFCKLKASCGGFIVISTQNHQEFGHDKPPLLNLGI
jgi:hypothetical protein